MSADFKHLKLLSYNVYILADRSTIYQSARLNLPGG
jgi:hypothetical protein